MFIFKAGGKENAIVDDNGGRVTFAWDGSFPANVFSFIPFEGKVFLGRNAIASGATPSGPFLSKEEVR